MKYEFLDHTADVKFRAYGKNLEEGFSNVALAITEIIMGKQQIKKSIKKTLSLTSSDLKSLLYDYMDNFLYLLDAQGFITSVVSKIEIKKKDNGYSLTATLEGDKVSKYKAETHIKAATYAEMEIEEKQNKVTIQVVLDL